MHCNTASWPQRTTHVDKQALLYAHNFNNTAAHKCTQAAACTCLLTVHTKRQATLGCSRHLPAHLRGSNPSSAAAYSCCCTCCTIRLQPPTCLHACRTSFPASFLQLPTRCAGPPLHQRYRGRMLPLPCPLPSARLLAGRRFLQVSRSRLLAVQAHRCVSATRGACCLCPVHCLLLDVLEHHRRLS